MSVATNNGLPKELLAAYQEACHVQGQPLEAFFEDAREKWDSESLLSLLDKVEEDIQENIALVLQANPDIEELALARSEDQRERIATLREAVQ
ncbi:MAG: hypothetical protein P1V51_13940 [Deltaproteobacteria bacterium]|nr:hypothetical protein [Deltaproteobacteria bacterium]